MLSTLSLTHTAFFIGDKTVTAEMYPASLQFYKPEKIED